MLKKQATNTSTAMNYSYVT